MRRFLLSFFTQRLLGIALCFFVFFLAAPHFAHAVVFESGIPGVGIGGAQGAPVPSVTKYVSYLYIFVLGMVGIAGFVSLVVWGTVWIASGIVDKKAMALESIKNTFIGIGIALVAYTILWTINPDLTIIKTPEAPLPSTTSSSVLCSSITLSGACMIQSTSCQWCPSSPYTPDTGTCINKTIPCP